ncbi:MAG: hypothetical protein BGO67_10175 [Alphaproteobacteria bacterium 41-28]|nr:MAG: hypothetical protein BGO67_10175 [Alphaproteobacteria bacterium 41-28]
MTREKSIYVILCVMFSVLTVVRYRIYQKFIFLPILCFHAFELSVGAILYPPHFSPHRPNH